LSRGYSDKEKRRKRKGKRIFREVIQRKNRSVPSEFSACSIACVEADFGLISSSVDVNSSSCPRR
jgi:hypothetical protein